MAGGQCVGSDPEVWFSLVPYDIAWCVAVCQGCPVLFECRAGAVARQEQYGIWGGRLFVDPDTLLQLATRGRSPKHRQVGARSGLRGAA